MTDFITIYHKLESENKLEREKAQKNITEYLEQDAEIKIEEFLQNQILNAGDVKNLEWKKCYSILFVLKALFKNEKLNINPKNYIFVILSSLEHPEPRVRIECGELIEIITKISDLETNKNLLAHVLFLIQDNLFRHAEPVSRDSSFGPDETSKLLHETCGWRFLESSLNALHLLIKSFLTRNVELISPEVIKVMISCSYHMNRFVREKGMYAFESLFEDNVLHRLISLGLIAEIVDALYFCMCDNWSQVRLAASMAARKLLSTFDYKSESITLKIFPAICLSRHYLAEGVKLYNIKTWELITKGTGSELVLTNLDLFVDFYVSQANADNHAVREAACHCLTELAYLLGGSLSNSHLSTIYDCLLFCFGDESWPVRDTACWAIGVNIASHPEFFIHKINNVFPLFCRNLTDSIQSVRTGAAISLTYVFNSYPAIVYKLIKSYLSEKFCAVKGQAVDVEKHQNLSKGPAVFGVAKIVDDSEHCDQVMYSCGSLAPKMRSGHKNMGECCDSHTFFKESQPWEISDGCLILIGELAKFYIGDCLKKSTRAFPDFKIKVNKDAVSFAQTLVHDNLEMITVVLGNKSFELHTHLFTTFYTYFPFIMSILEVKDVTDSKFMMFKDELNYGLRNKVNENLQISSEICYESLCQLYGPSSLRNIL